jgi:hypothetical protein
VTSGSPSFAYLLIELPPAVIQEPAIREEQNLLQYLACISELTTQFVWTHINMPNPQWILQGNIK